MFLGDLDPLPVYVFFPLFFFVLYFMIDLCFISLPKLSRCGVYNPLLADKALKGSYKRLIPLPGLVVCFS